MGRAVNEIEETLEALEREPVPAPLRMQAHREALLLRARQLKISGSVSAARVPRHRKWIEQFHREDNPMVLAKVIAALMMVFGLSAGTVFAADGSVPGGPLFALDQALERVQLSFAGSDEARAMLHIQLMAERGAELVALAEQGTPPDDALLDRVRLQAEEALQLALKLQDQDRDRVMTHLRDRAADLAENMGAAGYTNGFAAMNQVREQAQGALDDPLQARERFQAGQQPGDEDEAVVEDEAAATNDGEPDRDQDQTRDQLRDGSCGTCDGTPPADSTAEPAQDQLREQDQTQDQLRDGSCETCDGTPPTEFPGNGGPADVTPPEPPVQNGGSGNGGGAGQ